MSPTTNDIKLAQTGKHGSQYHSRKRLFFSQEEAFDSWEKLFDSPGETFDSWEKNL
jgi:hypothetical protein